MSNKKPKDPEYFKKYYEAHKDNAKRAKSKSYAINRCGLDADVAKHIGLNANIAGRFQKIYLQLKGTSPDTLDFMLQYLANEMIFKETEEDTAE
jgi:hypothetical protein